MVKYYQVGSNLNCSDSDLNILPSWLYLLAVCQFQLKNSVSFVSSLSCPKVLEIGLFYSSAFFPFVVHIFFC